MVSKLVSIINKKNYKMISKLIYKLTPKILVTNIFYSKLVSKILIVTNLEYKVVSR